jgi:hypothetical protein
VLHHCSQIAREQPHLFSDDRHVAVKSGAVREHVDVRELGLVLVRERKESADAWFVLVDDLHELLVEPSIVAKLALLDPPRAQVHDRVAHRLTSPRRAA